MDEEYCWVAQHTADIEGDMNADLTFHVSVKRFNPALPQAPKPEIVINRSGGFSEAKLIILSLDGRLYGFQQLLEGNAYPSQFEEGEIFDNLLRARDYQLVFYDKEGVKHLESGKPMWLIYAYNEILGYCGYKEKLELD